MKTITSAASRIGYGLSGINAYPGVLGHIAEVLASLAGDLIYSRMVEPGTHFSFFSITLSPSLLGLVSWRRQVSLPRAEEERKNASL